MSDPNLVSSTSRTRRPSKKRQRDPLLDHDDMSHDADDNEERDAIVGAVHSSDHPTDRTRRKKRKRVGSTEQNEDGEEEQNDDTHDEQGGSSSQNAPKTSESSVQNVSYPHSDLFPNLPALMFAFGDSPTPSPDTTTLLSEILFHQMNQLATDLTTGVLKPRIGMSSVFFELRDDAVKRERSNRIVQLRNRMRMLEKNGVDMKAFIE